MLILFFLVIITIIKRIEGITGTLDDVKHVVIFMQENRPFDHYFGKLKGVRGFNDRTTVPLKNKKNAFYQPVSTNDNDYMLPFRVDANQTNCMCMPAPEMYYPTDIKIYNRGRMDAWNTARDPGNYREIYHIIINYYNIIIILLLLYYYYYYIIIITRLWYELLYERRSAILLYFIR